MVAYRQVAVKQECQYDNNSKYPTARSNCLGFGSRCQWKHCVSWSIAQDVASATRTFLGECWYDVSQGLPYWQQILGEFPPLQYIAEKIQDAALTVPNVVAAKATFTSFQNRSLAGQIQIIDTDGATNNVAFGG